MSKDAVAWVVAGHSPYIHQPWPIEAAVLPYSAHMLPYASAVAALSILNARLLHTHQEGPTVGGAKPEVDGFEHVIRAVM